MARFNSFSAKVKNLTLSGRAPYPRATTKAKQYAYVADFIGGEWLVICRERYLHATKGLRDNRVKTVSFRLYDDALQYANSVGA